MSSHRLSGWMFSWLLWVRLSLCLKESTSPVSPLQDEAREEEEGSLVELIRSGSPGRR